jgi:hypothetical protein
LVQIAGDTDSEGFHLEHGDNGKFQLDEGDDEWEINGGESDANRVDNHCAMGGWEVKIRPDMLPTL